MSSAGALIDYLVKERALGDLNDEGIQGLEVREMKTLVLLVPLTSSSRIVFDIFSSQ
jgi:hypothetical protein